MGSKNSCLQGGLDGFGENAARIRRATDYNLRIRSLYFDTGFSFQEKLERYDLCCIFFFGLVAIYGTLFFKLACGDTAALPLRMVFPLRKTKTNLMQLFLEHLVDRISKDPGP